MRKSYEAFTLILWMAMMMCVVAFVGLSSCSKDDDELIVGKWKVVNSTNAYGEPDNMPIGLTYTFNSNGTVECFGFTTNWSLDGDKLTLDGEIITVEKLTSSGMTWLNGDGSRLYFNKL